MYLLHFLRNYEKLAVERSAYHSNVEYRLACSGELFNRRVLTYDWRKSDVTRVLLRSPFELFVVSRPFHSYPQELALRFGVDYAKEESGNNFTSTFLPDDEVVEDLCAVLTLLARRLITMVVNTRQQTD